MAGFGEAGEAWLGMSRQGSVWQAWLGKAWPGAARQGRQGECGQPLGVTWLSSI